MRTFPRPDDALLSQQKVKGLTFLTARNHFIATLDDDDFAAVRARLSHETRALLTEAEMSEMYPERCMQELMHAVYEVVAYHDDEVYLEIVRGLAVAGVSRFFRVLLGFASARFVLKKIPTIFARLREGTADLAVEDEGETIRIHYANYPFCYDPVHRMLSLGNCQAVVEAATSRVPTSRITECGPDSMTLEFEVERASRRRGKIVTVTSE